MANLPGGGQSQPVRNLSEETVVSVLSTLAEVVGSSVDAAKTLRGSQGIERLVLINKDGSVCFCQSCLLLWPLLCTLDLCLVFLLVYVEEF